jgi:predicted 3-demethylubiquinone-9 3-methyltransferase (glyoxalase superfamily)
MSRYQKVLWHHDHADEPVALYSEIDSGFEVRKIEVYRDGRHGYADRSRSMGTTVLGETVMPALDEINEDPEFSAAAITAEEFERVWQRASQEA